MCIRVGETVERCMLRPAIARTHANAIMPATHTHTHINFSFWSRQNALTLMQLSANAADERAASASFPAAMAATAKNVCSEEMKKKYVHIHTYW